ncbi:MAG: serine/threonine-protein kinase [Acidobacteriia bacterium]|nr:serine/threonine-protein kinase [Terriglobia bacterium]
MAGLSAGDRVGPYELLSAAGAGGMGEVWKAHDTRLDRIVALKFSQAQFSERFEREARAIAALNHPNIAQIYDVGENYLVMEFVEGEPVRAPEDVRKLLDIALQIADGLSTAHSAGIVHRDLKPDNILITKDRRVKILDFGLAKRQAAAVGDATRTLTVTDPGTVVGTVTYMSPEQASGREVDHRSDQFSFGLILYELAVRRRAFQRASAAETLTAIIREEAEPLPPEIPAPMRWTIERCMAKDPDQRYDSTRDLYRELRQTRDHLSQTLALPAAGGHARRSGSRWLWAAAIVIALAAGGLAGSWWQSLRRSAMPMWAGARLGGPVVAFSPRVSPDGQMLALLALAGAQTQVAIMKADGGSWNVLTHDTSNGSVVNVSWARDGSRLFFDRFWERASGVYSIPPLGGEPTLLLDDGWAPQALPDGSLVVLKRTPRGHDQVFRFWPESGRTEPLPAYLDTFDVGPPLRAFADGKEVVFMGATEEGGLDAGAQTYILNLSTRKFRRLDPQAPVNRFEFQLGIPLAPTPDGRAFLMLAREQNSFELIRVQRSGRAGHVPVLSFSNGSPPFSVDAAPDGSIYVDSADMTPSISRFTASGRLIAESPGPPPLKSMILPLVDGRLLIIGPFGDNPQLLSGNIGTDFRLFLQADAGEAAYASPAGADEVMLLLGHSGKRLIAFASVRNGVLRREVPVPGGDATAVAYSPSLKTIYYTAQDTIYSMPETGGTPERIADGDDLAIDPAGRMLVIHNSRGMSRIELPSGAAEPIALPAGMRLATVNLSPSAIDRHGRILLCVVTPQVFDYKPAIVDGRTITVIPTDRRGDNLVPGWTPDGDIIAVHDTLRSELWRFREVSK